MRTAWIGCLTVTVAVAVSGASAQTVRINGAGATFPNPIYTKWFSEYNKLHPAAAGAGGDGTESASARQRAVVAASASGAAGLNKETR